MTKPENIIAKGATLMFDETERTIAERGYTGIVKFLYTGYAELGQAYTSAFQRFCRPSFQYK